MTKMIVVRKKDVTVAESDAWLTPYNPNVGKVWSADDYYFIVAKDGFKTDVPFIDLQAAFSTMTPPDIKINVALTYPKEMTEEEGDRLFRFMISNREDINHVLKFGAMKGAR